MARTALGRLGQGKGRLAWKSTNVAIETAKHSRKLQIEGWIEGNKEVGQIAGRGKGRRERGCQNEAVANVDEVMAALGHEADARLAITAPTCVQNDAAAAWPVGIDERQDIGVHAVFAQCTDDERSFPLGIGRVIEVLEATSAAIAEVGAGGRYTLRRGAAQGEQLGTRALDLGIDNLARESKRHFDEAGSSPAESVAARAQGRYVKGYSRRHFASQRSHLRFFGHFSAFLNRQKRSSPRQAIRTDAKTAELSAFF